MSLMRRGVQVAALARLLTLLEPACAACEASPLACAARAHDEDAVAALSALQKHSAILTGEQKDLKAARRVAQGLSAVQKHSAILPVEQGGLKAASASTKSTPSRPLLPPRRGPLPHADGLESDAVALMLVTDAHVLPAAKAGGLPPSRGRRPLPHADGLESDAVALLRVMDTHILPAAKVALLHETAARGVCPAMKGWVPTGVVSLVMILVLGLMSFHVKRTSKAQAARSIYLMLNFILVMNYTVVILDSYDLCRAVGMSGAASGRMVGTYMLGFCLGAICMWMMVRLRPDLWRDLPRTVLLSGLSFQLVGSVCYTWVAHKAVASARPDAPDFGPFMQESSATREKLLPFLLIASRFISGIGSGSCQQFYVSGMLHLTPTTARSVHTARWVFSGMLAIGLGPVIAASQQEMEPCNGAAYFELAGHTQVIVAISSMIAAGSMHPDLSDSIDCLQSDSDDSDSAEPEADVEQKKGERWQRRLVVCGCLCMAALRAFGVSAIEVTIAMILEEKYHWDQRVTGVVIGAVFLCCIPLKLLHALANNSISVTSWIRLLAGAAFLGSWLLFGSARTVLPERVADTVNGATQLIIAGIIIFPTFYLSDALSSGLMHQHVLSEGSLLDGNHAQLWYNLSQGLGRFLGPWLARLAVQEKGQDSFAAQQMCVTLLFLVIFECAVRPFLKKGEIADSNFAPLRQVSM